MARVTIEVPPKKLEHVTREIGRRSDGIEYRSYYSIEYEAPYRRAIYIRIWHANEYEAAYAAGYVWGIGGWLEVFQLDMADMYGPNKLSYLVMEEAILEQMYMIMRWNFLETPEKIT